MQRMILPLLLFVGIACQPCGVEREATSTGSDVETITAWFEQYIDTVNAGDLEAWTAFVADDAVVLQPDGSWKLWRNTWGVIPSPSTNASE